MTTNMEQTVIEILNGVNNNVQQAVQFAMEINVAFVALPNGKTSI